MADVNNNNEVSLRKVSSIPTELEKSTVYFVQNKSNTIEFDVYISDVEGKTLKKLHYGDPDLTKVWEEISNLNASLSDTINDLMDLDRAVSASGTGGGNITETNNLSDAFGDSLGKILKA